MFTELKQKDKNGKDIIYRTISHADTLKLLKQMKENGYVNELISNKKNKSSFFLSKLLMGNTKGLFKKHHKYDISFTLTDKKRNYDDLMNIKTVNDYLEQDSSNKIIDFKDKSSKKELTNQEKIRILQGQKEAYEDLKYQNNNKNKKAL